jgi:hypothetical protein
VIPETPAPVSVTPVAAGVKVTWHRPKSYVDGTPLEDLGSFFVFRACGEDGEFVPIASIAVTDRQRFRKVKTFSFVDEGTPPDAPCRYRVVAATLDDYKSAPAEGVLGATPEPTPEATPTAPPPGAGAASPGPPHASPGLEQPPEEPLLPAPLVSPTPFPPAPW